MKTSRILIVVLIICVCGCTSNSFPLKRSTSDKEVFFRCYRYSEDFFRRYRYSFDRFMSFSLLPQEADVLLLRLDSLERIEQPDLLRSYYGYETICVAVLRIEALGHYFRGIFSNYYWEEVLYDECMGKNIGYSCFDIYDFMQKEREEYPKPMVLYLIIDESEIPGIKSAVSKKELILTRFTSPDEFAEEIYNYTYRPYTKMYRFIPSHGLCDTIYETTYFPYGKYDISKLKTIDDVLEYYDSIDRVVLKRFETEGIIPKRSPLDKITTK